MTRSHEEIKQLAANIVNSMLADLQIDFPKVGDAVVKMSKRGKEWTDWVDEQYQHVESKLLDSFGSSDR